MVLGAALGIMWVSDNTLVLGLDGDFGVLIIELKIRALGNKLINYIKKGQTCKMMVYCKWRINPFMKPS